MTQSSKEDLFNKWAPIIGSMGLTGSKADWLSEYSNNLQNQNLSVYDNTLVGTPIASDGTQSFPSLLPIAMQIAAKTIGVDLVSVVPLGISSEDYERMKAEIKAENRDAKIDAVIDDKEYIEKELRDHPDYGKGGPSGQLFYMDFKYGDSKKKKRKKKK